MYLSLFSEVSDVFELVRTPTHGDSAQSALLGIIVLVVITLLAIVTILALIVRVRGRPNALWGASIRDVLLSVPLFVSVIGTPVGLYFMGRAFWRASTH